jgi:Ca-activated chloride channel family protein
MRFEDPEKFILLIGVLALALFMFWTLARKKRLLNRFGDLPLILKNAPHISFGRQRTRALLLILAMILLCVTVARLQFGTHLEMVKREGLDIVIALDVSNSMLAQDIKPSRLDRAKQEIRSIIGRLTGDRVGLVPFAGDAYVQCPLTIDYPSAVMLLDAVDNTSVSRQGTNISEAIEAATKCFDQKERQHKVLLLLTDGEDHQGGAVEAAESARKEGIRIYTVGIGSPAGEPIPMLDRIGNKVGYRKDESGEVIVSKLDEETLQKVALATGGKYYNATPSEMELDRIFGEISKLEKKEQEGTLVTRFDDRYQWPLLFALVLLTLEFFLPERKKTTGELVRA